MPLLRMGCIGSVTFDPDKVYDQHSANTVTALQALQTNNFEEAICIFFGISRQHDRYIYRAVSELSLKDAQAAVLAGRQAGLHDWYGEGIYPSQLDCKAYVDLFDPSKNLQNTLKGLLANSKKDSLRRDIANYLSTQRFISPSLETVVPKRKQPYFNPYHDFWSWASQCLEWAGPMPSSSLTHTSHHVLIILMLHFGCGIPSYEALSLISSLAKSSIVVDMGSGNGYWTYLLRKNHNCHVVAVDNMQSTWRTTWINDTLVQDGIKFLDKRTQIDDILLLVYPIVGLDFTSSVLRAFKGRIICVVGTQNRSGYTAFRDLLITEWIAQNLSVFERVAQLPLPSFAGKDDALFVFERRSNNIA